MDENERITLRLEKENLELIDGFLKENTSHGNRSQLVREAVQAYIQTIREGGDRVTIHVPRYYLDLIDRLVADGYLLNREHAIVRSIEEWFTRERVKEIQDHKQEVDKATGKVVSVSTGDKDGAIPRWGRGRDEGRKDGTSNIREGKKGWDPRRRDGMHSLQRRRPNSGLPRHVIG